MTEKDWLQKVIDKEILGFDPILARLEVCLENLPESHDE